MRAQSSTEYTILIAAILILLAIMAGILMSDLPILGDETRVRDFDMSVQDVGIALYEPIDNYVGVVIKNNYHRTVLVENVTLNGELCAASAFPASIKILKEYNFSCANSSAIGEEPVFVVSWSDPMLDR